MEENEITTSAENTEATAETVPVEATAETAASPEITEDITYHAVEKDGSISAIWEMQGRRHLRTIDPRSSEGQQILQLFTAEIHETSDTAVA
jgi:hypothetical protein